MTLYDFILLDEHRQAETVWQGEFITYREELEATVILYRLQSFYVEVYYDRQSNAVTRLNPFRSRSRLGLYLTASLN